MQTCDWADLASPLRRCHALSADNARGDAILSSKPGAGDQGVPVADDVIDRLNAGVRGERAARAAAEFVRSAVCARPERKLCAEAGRGCWTERAPLRRAAPEPCRPGRASRPPAAVAKATGTVRSPPAGSATEGSHFGGH